MANIASVAYAIEGPQKNLEEILGAICLAMTDKKHWTEYKACEHLGFSEQELDGKRLGGEIDDDPTLENGVLSFYAEERWGLQDFNELLEQKFPDIKIYWVVEESGCEVYATNDKEGKYFPDRFYVDICIDDIYDSEYFTKEESMWKWISEKTGGKITNMEQAEAFVGDEDSLYDNFISIHQFSVMD